MRATTERMKHCASIHITSYTVFVRVAVRFDRDKHQYFESCSFAVHMLCSHCILSYRRERASECQAGAASVPTLPPFYYFVQSLPSFVHSSIVTLC